jgi:hypothetical protein
MSRRAHPDEVYEDDSFYEEVDRRRRSRDDRYFDPELGPKRHPVARSPPPVREIEERVRRRPRDRSAPDFTRERFLPPGDEDVLPPRHRDRGREDDLRLERETEEIYASRRTPPPRFRPRRISRDEEVEFEEVDVHRRRPREKEKVVFEERRGSSPPRREDVERDEVVFRKRERSLPPRQARENEDLLIEKDGRRYESSDGEIVEDEEETIIRRGHRPSRRDDIERERVRFRRHSLPPLDDHGERMEDEEDKVIIRHRDRSSGRRLPREEEREEEIIFEERDRSLPRRSRREELVVRHEDISPPRRRRDDEVDDVVIRRRSRSRPGREEDQDEVIFRHQRRPSPREDDREEIVIRHRDHSAPAREDDREEVRVRTRHRSSHARDEDEDDVVLRRRSAHLIDDDREEVIVRRDKHGRRLSLGTNIEEDKIILRDDDRQKGEEIEFRHVRNPHHTPVRSHSRPREDTEEIIIRQDDREGRNDVNREIIIRKDEERAESPEPAVIRKPPIVQELITHHRHIDSKLAYDISSRRDILTIKGYETIPPKHEGIAERSVADSVEEIEIMPRLVHSTFICPFL